MKAIRSENRIKHVKYLAGAAAFLWLLLALSTLFKAPSNDSHARMGAPIFANFEAQKDTLSGIRLTLADETYTLKRGGEGWVMQEAANYPVREDRIVALFTGLETLSFAETRTADPNKHALLGLDAPENGGAGVEIALLDAAGDVTDAFITGRRNDRLYIRLPGRDQTYRAGGDLPPFYNQYAWLDFDILTIEPAAIRAVRLRDQSGETLYLNRPVGAAAQDFRPAPPYQDARIVSRLGVSTTALALTRFAPRGAKPASDLTTGPLAEHITETFDGLEIAVQLYREPDGRWVTLRAIEAGEGARRAREINQKTETWAFQLSAFDFDDFTPTISRLVTRPEQDITEP